MQFQEGVGDLAPYCTAFQHEFSKADGGRGHFPCDGGLGLEISYVVLEDARNASVNIQKNDGVLCEQVMLEEEATAHPFVE